LFRVGVNLEYVVKRLISATLARDGGIKFNAYLALSSCTQFVPALMATIDVQVLVDFILAQSSIKKHCEGKASDIQAYAVGKILIFRALRPLLLDNIAVVNHLVELTPQFPELEEQIVELIYELTKGKKTQLAFAKVSPSTKAGFVLFTILRSKLKEQKADLNTSHAEEVIAELVAEYPKRSICLSYLGVALRKSAGETRKYLEEKLAEAEDGAEGKEVNYRRIYYLLQLFESFVSLVSLTAQNVWKYLSCPLLRSWLLQLRVQNKYIRRQAEVVKLSFQEDEALASDILKQLHKQKVSLSNMNIKHPLFPLVGMIPPETYFTSLMELCSQQAIVAEGEEAEELPLSELEAFVSVSHEHLKSESLTKAVELLVGHYHSHKNERTLQTLSRLFNSLLPESHKKKQPLLSKQANILGRLSLEQLELGEAEVELKNALKGLSKNLKEAKEEEHPLAVTYLNFMVKVGYYLLMHPEEAEIMTDLKLAYEDIKKHYLSSQEEGLAPKKKRKLNEEEKARSIHVLVDVFISLLTKSPHFLRHSINGLFEQLVPFVEGEDLSHLLEVVQRPDKEYIEEMDNE
jgi:hypothetical protein